MVRRRRSLQQQQLLVALGVREATSVTELADRIQAKRPSVSCSLKLLVAEGLVTQTDPTVP